MHRMSFEYQRIYAIRGLTISSYRHHRYAVYVMESRWSCLGVKQDFHLSESNISLDGYLFHAEPYSGSTTKLPQTGLGQGPDVVLGLMNKVYAREGNHVVMDNLFTSIPLLNELSKKDSFKKWWCPLFSWGIGAALVNVWRLYRALGHDISLLQFTREGSQEILGKFGIPSIGPGRSLVLQKNAFNQQSYDRKDHWLYKSDKQFGRCKNCGGISIYRCEKCQVPLHP
ncbi:hypothetical protein AVEN_81963-1 [Araneus ventricosus]|uniref:PiggyBac transposable element-derived protein domain-containing protein n=1 Tax=Araneus ventricosus TaxID=182803 RepID=A0A4Y2IMD9_ARAVE|nr:hypothetical protein AVEN_81963-1 [Araneus ventricosus]